MKNLKSVTELVASITINGESAANLISSSEIADLAAMDADQAAEWLRDELQKYIDKQEVVYYHSAMEYLTKNDDSLTTSLAIAHDLGYTCDVLNSETLATLLLQQELSEQLSDLIFVFEEEFEALPDLLTFDELVEAATESRSDLEHAVRGLFIFALANATPEDIDNFIEWLGEEQDLTQIHTANTNPGDHFQCAEGMNWQELEEIYSDQKLG